MLAALPPKQKSTAPRWTYFIRASSGFIKIGCTRNLSLRLKHLKQGNHEELALAHVLAGDREKEMHDNFAEYLVRGEWFKEAGALEEFMNDRDFWSLDVYSPEQMNAISRPEKRLRADSDHEEVAEALEQDCSRLQDEYETDDPVETLDGRAGKLTRNPH
jgi:hypothetical protein